VIAAAARDYSNVVLANWLATIAHHTNLLWGDGVHPCPAGARLYARLVASAVPATGLATAPPVGRRPEPGGRPGITGR
jgi:hypothetical protein